MKDINIIWLKQAIKMVADGDTDKICKDGVTVYKVKNIVRVDVSFKG